MHFRKQFRFQILRATLRASVKIILVKFQNWLIGIALKRDQFNHQARQATYRFNTWVQIIIFQQLEDKIN